MIYGEVLVIRPCTFPSKSGQNRKSVLEEKPKYI